MQCQQLRLCLLHGVTTAPVGRHDGAQPAQQSPRPIVTQQPIPFGELLRQVRQLPAGASAPLQARLIAAASLLLWFGVIWTGRFIAFTGKNTL